MFFRYLADYKLIMEWAPILDWLFDDMKFSRSRNWNGGYTSVFTKRVKSLEYLSDKEKRVEYGRLSHFEFPNQRKYKGRKRLPYIMMSSGDSFARDLIRHIRNGVAHSEVRISKVHEEPYIEIIDYSDKSKSPEKQTAYLFFPLSYVGQFYKVYCDINRGIMNTKEKDRLAKRKYRNG